jgi:hypothetical protein
VSDKCEFSAKTIRKKIHHGVDLFLEAFPSVHEHSANGAALISSSSSSSSSFSAAQSTAQGGEVQWLVPTDGGGKDSPPRTTTLSHLVEDTGWESILTYLSLQEEDAPGLRVKEVTWAEPGERGGIAALRRFIGRVDQYDATRNDPAISSTGSDTEGGVSGLSPWIHFGMLSAQRCLLEIKRLKNLSSNRALFPAGDRTTGVHAFCEELVVRRELSDNFCYYNDKYDQIEGAHR